MTLPSLKEITDKALNAFQRFPIALSWAIVGSLLCIAIVNVDPDALFDHYTELLLTFVLGISWIIGTRFFIEEFRNSEKWEWLQLVIVLLLILFYWHLPDLSLNDIDPKFYNRFFLYLIAGHLFLFLGPFILKWDQSAYWNYLKAICIAIGRSVLFSGVLYLGLVLALLAIESLFDIKILPRRYGQLFIVCLGIVNTWTYLSDFPKNITKNTVINYNRVLEVFVTYILIPLVLLYLVILYAYSLKIVWEWELPKGWVSYLVTALALLGFLIQVMINPIQKTIKSWSIQKFYPWFYILLLPLILLLFVAIFKRIGDYGITENRYFVLILACWILGITVYLLASKKKYLKVLPITLLLLALLSSFGYWGAFGVSKRSQINQFKKVLQQVQDNKNVATEKQYQQLGSIVDYLGDRQSLSQLDPVVGLSVHDICKDTTQNPYKVYGYNASRKLLDTLYITLETTDSVIRNNNYYNYYSGWNTPHNYTISGFDYFCRLDLTNYRDLKQEIGNYDIRFNKRDSEIYLLSKAKLREALTIPLKNKFIALSQYGGNLNNIDKTELSIEVENDTLLLKLVFTKLGFYIKKDSVVLNHGNGFMFLKQK